MRVLGAVLTGGSSSRMGTDKAFVEVDGRPMVMWVAAALLAGGAQHVVCVGGDAERIRLAGLEPVPDDHPGEGPLAGIATALDIATDAGAAVLLVSACDYPWLDVATVSTLLAELAESGSVDLPVGPLVPAPPAVPDPGVSVPGRGQPEAVVATGAGGRDALVLALRVPEAGVAARAAFAAGSRSLGALLDALVVRRVRPIDPRAVQDVDDPGAL